MTRFKGSFDQPWCFLTRLNDWMIWVGIRCSFSNTREIYWVWLVIFFLKKNLTEIFWNGQVCNEGDGGVCCKKNYELTNGVVVKIKKDSFAPYHPDDQDHHDDHQILIIIIEMLMIIIQMLMIICRWADLSSSPTLPVSRSALPPAMEISSAGRASFKTGPSKSKLLEINFYNSNGKQSPCCYIFYISLLPTRFLLTAKHCVQDFHNNCRRPTDCFARFFRDVKKI